MQELLAVDDDIDAAWFFLSSYIVFFFIRYFGHTFDLMEDILCFIRWNGSKYLADDPGSPERKFWKDLQRQKETREHSMRLHPLWCFLSKYLRSHTWLLGGRKWGVHMFISFPLPQSDDYLCISAVLLRHFSVKFVFPHWTLSRISSAKSQKPSGAIKR